MSAKAKADFNGYQFDCNPVPMADGGFGAQITISKIGGAEQSPAMRFPVLDYFHTEDEAIEYAQQWGALWVNDHG